MAKNIKTWEQRLLDTLLGLPKMEWFRIDNREDFEKITEAVKGFIDCGEPLEFSNDYKKLRRISTL